MRASGSQNTSQSGKTIHAQRTTTLHLFIFYILYFRKFSNMKQKNEIQHLESIIKLQEMKRLPFIFTPLFLPIMWLLTGASIAASKKAYEAGSLHPYLFVAIIVGIGVAIGFHSVYKASYKAWPVIGPYINTNKIIDRINKLKTERPQ